MEVVEGAVAVAVAGGSTLTVVLPTILAAVEGTEAVVALVTTSATRGNVTAAATEAEAVGISKIMIVEVTMSNFLSDLFRGQRLKKTFVLYLRNMEMFLKLL